MPCNCLGGPRLACLVALPVSNRLPGKNRQTGVRRFVCSLASFDCGDALVFEVYLLFLEGVEQLQRTTV